MGWRRKTAAVLTPSIVSVHQPYFVCFCVELMTRLSSMASLRSISLVGTLLAATLLGSFVPQPGSAQGILPTFRNSRDRFVELRTGIQRGYRSASSARYHLYVPDPEVTSQRFIITEVTNNFAQQGGRLSLDEMDVRLCSDMGNALRRPRCEERVPLEEITYCSIHGCTTYNPSTGVTTQDEGDYEGLPYISIKPVNPIEAGTPMDIVFSNVKNPRSPVDYQFNLSIETPRNLCAEDWRTALGHCAIGTWIVPIRQNNRF